MTRIGMDISAIGPVIILLLFNIHSDRIKKNKDLTVLFFFNLLNGKSTINKLYCLSLLNFIKKNSTLTTVSLRDVLFILWFIISKLNCVFN